VAVHVYIRPYRHSDHSDLVSLGVPGHEIVQVYDGQFVDASLYELAAMSGSESNGASLKAVWHSVGSFRPEQPLYPDGLVELLLADGRDLT
jgi:hypothetical protein